MSLPQTYKAYVLTAPNAPLELQELELKPPSRGEILVKVLACGCCLSDAFLQQGHLPNPWPIVPGHEIVGDVVALGEDVSESQFKIGDRVGAGWHGGHDNTCTSCRRAQFQMCDAKAITGVTRAGGYAEYVLLRSESIARIPAGLSPSEAAPLMCAGVTVFNGLRKLHIEQGGLVAVQGLGGLGHVAVQYARAMGYRVVVLSRGGSSDKRDFATQLGAHAFIDTSSEDAAAVLSSMGGASAIISTAPNPAAMGGLVEGLQNGGKLLVLAPVGPVSFDTGALVSKGASVHGWPSGHALDWEEAMRFAGDHGVKCLVEEWAFERTGEAFEGMSKGEARFKNVLVMG